MLFNKVELKDDEGYLDTIYGNLQAKTQYNFHGLQLTVKSAISGEKDRIIEECRIMEIASDCIIFTGLCYYTKGKVDRVVRRVTVRLYNIPDVM